MVIAEAEEMAYYGEGAWNFWEILYERNVRCCEVL